MKKSFFATALACALTIFGIAASAQDQQAVAFDEGSKVFSSNVTKSLSLLVATSSDVDLSEHLSAVSGGGAGRTFGYTKNGGGFVSLADAVNTAKVVSSGDANVTAIRLGDFSVNDKIQFGYEDDGGFHPYSPFKIESDPGYYGGYNPDSFYQLDFSEDPFDGMIEILVVGEPLPTPVVTLIVALAAGALFLLYKNRRQRPVYTEQA